MLVLVCGLPGAGKSTLAKAIAEKRGAAYISSDAVRREALDERTYSPEEKFRVYDAMLRKAEAELKEGRGVVLDATFYRRELRGKAREAAERAGAGFRIIECTAEENLLKERMDARKGGLSEADFGIYMKVKGEYEPVEEGHLVVDTSLPLERQLKLAEEYLG